MSNVDHAAAPPVVAVTVVHEPGPWFDDVLQGLAAQDYPNLRYLFLVTGGDVAERITSVLPSAFVRSVEGNPGFGPTANTVLDLVEGENGFFCFLHDDVALDPDAIRLLVEELYRSNAGIVGPKLVEWDTPRRLHRVGLAVDRVGEIDTLVEPGELDQEQHDAVRDVFALPTACLLVRADLFRTLEFDSSIDYHGDDVNLCWRAHLLGARVLLVPAARGRHRGLLVERRPDLPHRRLMTKHRVHTVTTLTGARRLPGILVWLILITVGELVIGVFTGRARESWSTLVAVVGLVPRAGSIAAQRRHVRELRHVPDHEVAELQVRGSARLRRFMRARQAGGARVDGRRLRVRRSPTAAFLAWVGVLVVALAGSRHLITGGVTPIGEFLPFLDQPSVLFQRYLDGWWDHGLGSPGAPPTGLAVLGAAGLAAWANMGLAHTMLSVGLIFVGYLGAWRLCSLMPGDRARVAGLVVYAAVPLPYASLAGGRWSGVAAYAAVPWLVHLLRIGSGLGDAADLDAAGRQDADPLAADLLAGHAGNRMARVRAFAGIVLVTALVVAFVPSFVVVLLVTAAALAAATLVASGRLGATATLVGMSLTGAVLALALHLPWSLRFFERSGDDAFLGVPLAGPRSEGVIDLARFGVGGSAFGVLALGLYVPVVVGPLIARGWRFAWAVRAAFLVVVPGVLLVAADRGSMPIIVSDPALLMAPIALGMALGASCVLAAFSEDIRDTTFGWRQPLGVVTALAVVVGILPVLVGAIGGRWDQPTNSLGRLLQQLPADPAEGDYRVLFVGDPRVLPVPGWSYRDGLAYALTDDGPLSADETWLSTPSSGVRFVADVLDAIADDQTARAGRALAPLGIRFIVIPLADGTNSTVADPLPPPAGLLDVLGDQLDLRRRSANEELVILENMAWMPTRAVLAGATSEASNRAGLDALAQADLTNTNPIAVGQTGTTLEATIDAPAVVHLAVPRSAAWRLELDGVVVPPRSSFGLVTAWDVDGTGEVRLTVDPPSGRALVVAVQAFVWFLFAVLALYHGPWRPRRRTKAAEFVELESTGPVLELSGQLDLAPLPSSRPHDVHPDDVEAKQ